MAHFKGHKVKTHEGEVVFDQPVDIGEIKKAILVLRERRRALREKRDKFEQAMQRCALEENELTDLLAEIGETL